MSVLVLKHRPLKSRAENLRRPDGTYDTGEPESNSPKRQADSLTHENSRASDAASH